MSTRRQFVFGGLAALAAGCATRLEQPVPNIVEPWQVAGYDNGDLIWATGSWTNVVDPGTGASTSLRYRRVNGVFYWDLDISIGSGAVFPSNGQWYFEMPDYFEATQSGAVPGGVWGSGMGSCAAAASYTSFGLHAQANRAQTLSSVTKPAIVLQAPDTDIGLGSLSAIFPGVWASGDGFQASGWLGCLDN